MSGATCIRPTIFAVPTPFAMPDHRLSISRLNPHFCAASSEMMVICAPLSTKALSGVLLTSQSMYSITTCAAANHKKAIAQGCLVKVAQSTWMHGPTYPAKGLRVVFERSFHVLPDVVLHDLLFYRSLGLEVERVVVQLLL